MCIVVPGWLDLDLDLDLDLGLTKCWDSDGLAAPPHRMRERLTVLCCAVCRASPHPVLQLYIIGPSCRCLSSGLWHIPTYLPCCPLLYDRHTAAVSRLGLVSWSRDIARETAAVSYRLPRLLLRVSASKHLRIYASTHIALSYMHTYIHIRNETRPDEIPSRNFLVTDS